MYTESELELIKELEKCNSEYLQLSKKYIKNRITIMSILNSISFRLKKRKYYRMYGANTLHVYDNADDGFMHEAQLPRIESSRIAVYTCISGNYDSRNEPRFALNPNIEYIMFTDLEVESSHWEVRRIPSELEHLSSVQRNRYLKMHPHQFLKGFDYSIYIDGNVLVISDLSPLVTLINPEVGFAMYQHCDRNCVYQEAVACQLCNKGNKNGITSDILRYTEERFPKNYGLLECTIFAVDLHSEKSTEIMNKWWEEFLVSKSCRDQLSLPFVLWKNGITIDQVGTLGRNLYKNPKIRVLSHLT